MEAVDPHRHRLEPLFDVVPDLVVEPTAQFVTREGSQIATSIDEKLCVGDIVVLVSRCRNAAPGSVPRRLNTSTARSSFDSVSRAA